LSGVSAVFAVFVAPAQKRLGFSRCLPAWRDAWRSWLREESRGAQGGAGIVRRCGEWRGAL